MKIDLFKLNNLGKVTLDSDVTFDKEIIGTMDVIDIKDTHINGELTIDYDDNLCIDAFVKGVFVISDAYTLEPLDYSFETNINEIIGKYDDFYNKNKNSLDILPFLWENIVSEVPIRYTKIDKTPDLKGDGWSLE